MAEIIENVTERKEIPSMTKANAGLTLGIIGTSLGAITALGGLGALGGMFDGNGRKSSRQSDQNYQVLSDEELFLERSMNHDRLSNERHLYENMLHTNHQIDNLHFDMYKNDVENNFAMYKMTRDANDSLTQKINDVDKKVDILAAIRPYQDALMESRINQTALVEDYNLFRRTAKMVEGRLVLPSEPVVTGYGSLPTYYNPAD